MQVRQPCYLRFPDLRQRPAALAEFAIGRISINRSRKLPEPANEWKSQLFFGSLILVLAASNLIY